MAERELNLLALDGGGVRALSTLYILKNLMEAIDRENPPKPCDFFDMIGGTGSGGLLAIMLGRLKMDIDQCITGYTRLCKHVFGRKKRLSLTNMGAMTKRKSRPKHDAKKLEFALKSILRELGHEGRDMLLQDLDLSCRVFVCVTDSSTHKLVPLTTYPSKYCPLELYKTTKVWEAGVASFAHASLFDPVPLGPSRRRFQDSSMQATNPIREVWIEAKNVWRLTSLESQLRCMVSIGTGLPTIKRAGPKPGVFGFSGKTQDAMVADPEVETNKFIQEHSELDDDNRLFRFDVPNGLAEIELDAIGEMETIVDATQDYLAKELVYKQVRRCGKALARPASNRYHRTHHWGLLISWSRFRWYGSYQMRKMQKVLISGIFLLGSFVCIASIIRIYPIIPLKTNLDSTWIMGDVYVWSSVEPCIGIVCARLPALQPLIRQTLKKGNGVIGCPEQNGYLYTAWDEFECQTEKVNLWVMGLDE